MNVCSLHNYFQDEEEQNEKVEETNDDHEENDEEEELIEELGNTSNIVTFIRYFGLPYLANIGQQHVLSMYANRQYASMQDPKQ